jgi:hypothetical protein
LWRVWSCLHADCRGSTTEARLNKAFDAFSALEKLVLNEKDSPTQFQKMPTTHAEWEALKAKVAAERRAKRAASAMARDSRPQHFLEQTAS